jgi:hypothetical protein
MKEPRWVTRIVVDAVHFDQIREHGGLPGIRDEEALESALDRRRNKWSYKRSDLADLAAAYAFGLARNHPYRLVGRDATRTARRPARYARSFKRDSADQAGFDELFLGNSTRTYHIFGFQSAASRTDHK